MLLCVQFESQPTAISPQNATCNPQPGVAFLRIFWSVATSTRCNPIKYNIYYFFQVIYKVRIRTRAHPRKRNFGLRVAVAFSPSRKRRNHPQPHPEKRNPQPATRNSQPLSVFVFRRKHASTSRLPLITFMFYIFDFKIYFIVNNILKYLTFGF